MTISRKALSFAQLKDAYPLGHKEDVKALIGGKVNAEWVANTCAIRMSRALNYTGVKIPRNVGLSVVSGADKLWYAYRVRELCAWLKKELGKPDFSGWGTGEAPAEIQGKQGILMIEAKFSDATGHITLWNETACVDDSDYFAVADRVFFWETGP